MAPRKMTPEEIRESLIKKGYTFGDVSPPNPKSLADELSDFFSCKVSQDYSDSNINYRSKRR